MDDLRHEQKEARFSVALLFSAVRRTRQMNPEAGRLAYEEFRAKSFFTLGASVERSASAAATLREEFLALPTEYTSGPNAIIRALLDHLPAALETQRLFWQDRLFESECTATPLPWTYPQLSRLVAQSILVGCKRSGPSVSSAFGRGQHGAGPRQRPTDKGRERGGGEMYCWNCGSAQHRAKECTQKCRSCGLSFCSAVRGGPCPVIGTSDLRSVRNAKGGPLPDFLVKRLEDRRAAISKGFKVSSAEVTGIDLEDDLYPPVDEGDDALDFLESLGQDETHPSDPQVSYLQASSKQQSHLSSLASSLQQLAATK